MELQSTEHYAHLHGPASPTFTEIPGGPGSPWFPLGPIGPCQGETKCYRTF